MYIVFHKQKSDTLVWKYFLYIKIWYILLTDRNKSYDYSIQCQRNIAFHLHVYNMDGNTRITWFLHRNFLNKVIYYYIEKNKEFNKLFSIHKANLIAAASLHSQRKYHTICLLFYLWTTYCTIISSRNQHKFWVKL